MRWLPVLGFEGLYEVSECGSIRGIDRIVGHKLAGCKQWRGKILKPAMDDRGRLRVRLCKSGRVYSRFVHRIVLEAFVGPCPRGMEACHDPDPTPRNCRLDNLRWDTHKGNKLDQVRHGRATVGERHGMVKLTDADVNEIRASYKRSSYHSSSARELAARYGVDVTSIQKIIRQETWRHLLCK